ncbi:MAG TPA: hypothetical protein VGS19_15615 [Streptosporangiaceae bacterium]|nr:hypothetical protein [Streptosporangiaceae bacterium]
MAVLIIAAVFGVTSLAGWIAYLRFCRFLVNKTNDAESLKHAATAARAFRAGAPAALAQALGRLLSLRGR